MDTLQTSAILSNANLYIGTSLHGAVVTLAFGKPAVSYSQSDTGKHKGVLSVVGLELCYEQSIDKIPIKAEELVNLPAEFYRRRVNSANDLINQYFDRISEIVKNKSNSFNPRKWSQNSNTGEISCISNNDFHELKRLCLVKNKEVSMWRRLLQCVVRQSHSTAESYDRLIFWLRQR